MNQGLTMQFLFVTLALSVQAAFAGEWPQILGPHRTGIADNEKIADKWPGGGPKTLWSRRVGEGYAGVAVAGGKVVLFHRLGDSEIAEAMDAKTGSVLWKQQFSGKYAGGFASDNGPRCVPLVHKDYVYLYGISGNLHCLSLKTGKKRWSRKLAEDYQAPGGYFGAGSTPIVEADKLLLNLGGRPDAGIVALSPETGKTVWNATSEKASYSSPTTATIDGVRHAIFVTRLNLVSIDPENGNVRFSLPFGRRGATVNAATPLVVNGNVFVSASYGVGAMLVRVETDGAREVWANDEVMSSQYTTCVPSGGHLFGISGRQDMGRASLRCLKPDTGKVKWSKDGFGKATLILADDKLVILKTNGELVLAKASTESYQPLAFARVLRSTALALPAISNGLLYVRDTRTLKCLDLKAPSTKE